MENDVVNYIVEAQQHGLSETEIKQNLLNAGWEAPAIEESFGFAKATENKMSETQIPETHMAAVMIAQTSTQTPLAQASTVSTMPEPAITPSGPSLTSSSTPLSDSNFSKQPKIPAKWLKIGLIALGALIVLGAGGYLVYAQTKNAPTKAWQAFLLTPQDKIYQSDINFSYSDPNTLNASSIPISLENLKFSFNGNFYADTTDVNNPRSDTNVQYTYGSGNTSFTTGFQYILLNNVLYVNIGDNPLLSLLGNSLAGRQKVQWIKFDLKALEAQASTTDTQEMEQFKNIFNTEFTNQLQKIWNDANAIKIGKYVGKETINNFTTYHFQNTLDKAALKNAFDQMLSKIVSGFNQAGANISDQDRSDVQFAVDTIIDKLQVQDMETWIGQSDHRLYKVHVASNAPSLISAIQNAANQFGGDLGAQPTSRDAKRVTDVRQMASALELYFNDNNGYPEADSNGQPAGGMSPTYISVVPVAPTPPDGNCTDYYNTYWYQPMGTKTVSNGKTVYSSYQFTFCLGSSTGGYKAGIGMLTPSGIQDNIQCPSSDLSKCANPNAQPAAQLSDQDKIRTFINNLQFNANVTVEATYHDYGKAKTLTPPTDYLDIMQSLTNARSKARDAKRLADVRQLESALELYFNDKNQYPSNLTSLQPNYIGLVPTPPTPADGSCSDQDNNYAYQLVAPGQYTLQFCLGQDAGGYTAGKHMATEKGIQ